MMHSHLSRAPLLWSSATLALLTALSSAGVSAATAAPIQGAASGKGYTWAEVARWPDIGGDWSGGSFMGPPPSGGPRAGGAPGTGGPPPGGAGGPPLGGRAGGPGGNMPFTAAFQAKVSAAQRPGLQQGLGNCEPMGVIADSGGSFYVSRDVIVIGGLSDWYNVWRRIYMDGRGHPPDVEPSYFGHSIGHWEDATLVIDTVAIRSEAQLRQGLPVGNFDTHILERLRLIDKDTIELKRTITNPEVFARPWEVTRTLRRGKDEYFESYCWTDRDEVAGGDLTL